MQLNIGVIRGDGIGPEIVTEAIKVLNKVGDVYGQILTVEFVSRLRSERRFESREALVEQLKADRAEAMKLLVNSE
jgi:FAD synthase